MRKRDVRIMGITIGLILLIVFLAVFLFNTKSMIYTTGGTFQTDYCTPDCTGKVCGDDGCGGSCGSCPTGKTCSDGACVSSCTPDCTGKVCGDDGCGGSCGSCPTGETCSNGQCISCTPDCTGKECGDDGCGGSCGSCLAGETCSNGACIVSEFECSDTVDNDADQLIDDKDPGCWSDVFDPSSYLATRNNEGAATTQCQDNIDNDGDDLIDENDPGCLLAGNYDLTDNDEDTETESSEKWYSEKSLFGTSEFNILIWILLGGLLAAIGGSIYFFIWKSRKKRRKGKGKKRKKRK